MADEILGEIEYVSPEKSDIQHRWYHPEINGVIFGKTYQECIEGAKVLIRAETNLDKVDESKISIPDFE